jgi:polysaccharide deacetylase family protein (PEP-CTERM system associated)
VSRNGIVNAFSVDLEDWMQSTIGPDEPITPRVIANLDRMLKLLERHGVRATFFCLGKVCEIYPQLIERVVEAEHEIASHGYGHELVYTITPERFRADLERSIEIIERQAGRRPIGYRAPAFSVTRESLWAAPILVELGFKYSSSVFPIRGSRYGMPDAPRFPYKWDSCDLLEFPLTTVPLVGRNLPMCGGGYFRLLPWPILASAIGRVNREGHPVVVYMHPYEMDVNELAELEREGYRFSRKTYVGQSLFRGRIHGRLSRLFSEFRFGTMAEVLGLE